MPSSGTRSTSPEERHIVVPPGGAVTAIAYPAAAPALDAVLILGHGAGAGQRSPWMVQCARALNRLGVDILTFDFLYTEQGRRLPDRQPILEACYRAVVDDVRRELDARRPNHTLFIGGKSMGGRIATHVAAADRDLPVRGLVLLGYPLHPPGRPETRRDAHLPAVGRPMLFVQGERDSFGTPRELEAALSPVAPAPTVHVVERGDHSFKISGRNPERQAALFDEAYRAIAGWIARTSDRATR